MTQRYLSRPYSPTSFPTHFPHSLQNLRPYDPSSDRGFYLQPRFVNHIDDHAISELSVFYNDVLPRSGQSTDEVGKASRPLPRVLDICSSWVSHIPLGGAQGGNTTRKPSAREIGMEVIGIGMNAAELAANPILSAWVVHDLNQEPDFASVGPLLEPGRGQAGQVVSPEDLSTPFDAVICNVSIDYLSRPLEIMSSIARALRPGGEAYMAISNRCFPTKVRPSFPVNPFLPSAIHQPSLPSVKARLKQGTTGRLTMARNVNNRPDQPRRFVLLFRRNTLRQWHPVYCSTGTATRSVIRGDRKSRHCP